MSPSQLDRRQILSDAERMRVIASGDARMLESVMREEAVKLVNFALSLLHDHSEAEELLQEAFLRLWQQAQDWRAEARISTWLHRVVYRLAVDRLRRRKPSLDIADFAETLPSDAASPEETLWHRQRADMLESALEQLAPTQAAAVVLAYRQGLSQAEASAILGVSQEAYESLLARGRRRLKVLIETAAATQEDGECDGS